VGFESSRVFSVFRNPTFYPQLLLHMCRNVNQTSAEQPNTWKLLLLHRTCLTLPQELLLI
jgi:hypothetical protein